MTRTALFVDDSNFARATMMHIFQELFPDWEVVSAKNGHEAIDLASSRALDFASIDLNMPGIDGFETSAGIRELQPDLKIYLVTANIQEAVQTRAAEEKIGFVAKPITETVLASIMKEEFDVSPQ